MKIRVLGMFQHESWKMSNNCSTNFLNFGDFEVIGMWGAHALFHNKAFIFYKFIGILRVELTS